ncbi:MAG: tetratricopeptide repeat protein [Bacteroidales bacterium]|nr:tetratricopeptide repeat protein [Bacteroidales bacterium]
MTLKSQYKNRWTTFAVWLCIISGCFFLTTCSTKKNTFTSRAWHNTTAHYNVYWNGKFSMEEGLKEYNKKIKDNYTSVLPVYNVGTLQESSQFNSTADRAIEKGSITIQRHSMRFGDKEKCKWIDDAYLLIGKGYFYKQEYSSAKRTFEHIILNYPDENIKFESKLWLVHTFDKQKKFSNALTELESARIQVEKGEISKRELLYHFNTITANHFILSNQYDDALPYLKNSIMVSSNGKQRNRLRFIIGQIYQSQGKLKEASEWYSLLLKKNMSYELTFNTRINMAKCYSVGGKDIIPLLEKMLKDKKNENYLDQIHYAIAEIETRKGNMPKAKEELALSVATSVDNNYQKAQSSIILADYLFEDQLYEASQAYFDTALQVLPNDYPNYDQIHKKGEILTNLVENLLTVRHQDSLQKVAKMSEAERSKLINQLIKEVIDEERRQQEEQSRMALIGSGTPRMNQNSGGGWYFYNSQILTQGRQEFLRKFGTRKLEDLWIISNKQMLDWDDLNEEEGSEEGEEEVVDSVALAQSDPKNKAYYLKDLPLTPELIKSSDSMIALALFNIGTIYREDLNDRPQAITAFETLLKRYPDTSINKNLMVAYYFLMRTCEDDGNITKQKAVEQEIVQQYPESDLAKLIIDPEYHLELEKKTNAVEHLYLETYQAFLKNQHYTVILNTEKAEQNYSDHALMPKFELLRAMVAGKIETQDSLIARLNRLIAQYPDADVTPMAQEILQSVTGMDLENYLAQADSAAAQAAAAQATNIYSTDNLNGNNFLVLITKNSRDLNAIKVRFSDFNQTNYKLDNLIINNVVWFDDYDIITIGLFKNKTNAIKYYNHIINEKYLMGLLEKNDHFVYIITTDNYPIFYQAKQPEQYQLFFKTNYPDE